MHVYTSRLKSIFWIETFEYKNYTIPEPLHFCSMNVGNVDTISSRSYQFISILYNMHFSYVIKCEWIFKEAYKLNLVRWSYTIC